MIWKVTVRQYAPGYWCFRLTMGRKVLRKGRLYSTQGEACYAAGRATFAEIELRNPPRPLEIIKDFDPS